jgi:uncharacterized protein YjeT (DUF2065 family)
LTRKGIFVNVEKIRLIEPLPSARGVTEDERDISDRIRRLFGIIGIIFGTVIIAWIR